MNLIDFVNIVTPYSMTGYERIKELYDSLEYIKNNKIDGDLVECGVWKGGNILGMMEYLHHHRIDKNIWIFDTFSGMTPPTEKDYDLNGISASRLMENPIVFAKSTLDEVNLNLSKSNFDKSKLKFVVGDVSQTLRNPENIPEELSLLRLDTDWYESTKDELAFLYPKLILGGILIVDDYGHWAGSKLAVDEYFKNEDVVFDKIDYTGIKIKKTKHIIK